MKKIIPILAVTALLATGCGASKTKLSEKQWKEEVTDYGCFLNRNAVFEGDGSMGLYEVKLTVKSASDGKNVRVSSVIEYLVGENAGSSMQSCVIGEINEEVFNGDFYVNEGGPEGTWRHQVAADYPLEDFKKQMIEFTYFARFEYSSVKYDDKQKAYTFDKITDSIVDHGDTLEVTYRNGVISFKGGELVSYKHTMSVSSMTISVNMERTQKGGAEVVAPTIE